MNDGWTCPSCGFYTDNPGVAREHDCNVKSRLKEFIQTASEAAWQYDCYFVEMTFGEDERGLYAQTTLIDTEDEFVGDEEMPKLRLVDVKTPIETFFTVVLVEWLDNRANSLCTCPHDLMAVFHV